MNLLKLLPRFFRVKYEKNIKNSGIKKDFQKLFHQIVIGSFLFSLILSFALFFIFRINMIIVFIISFLFFHFFFYFYFSLKSSTRVKEMESVFPDFIRMMASNLRAGMTIEKAFLISARPEFFPLTEEIQKTGKDIAVGKNMVSAFQEMSERINSERINKTIYLIVSGINAGGNISTLLEQTSINMREKEFLEKRAASNVLMYVIFIFFAVGVGAPILFSLSSILIEVVINISSNIPTADLSRTSLPLNVPFAFTDVGISPHFIIYFSLIFMVLMDIISSLLIGLINKGEEKQGLKYAIPLIMLSVSIFFIIRIVLRGFISESFFSS